MTIYRAAVIGLGRMGSTFDNEMTRGGSIFIPYCHGPAYFHSPKVESVAGADIHGERFTRHLRLEDWNLKIISSENVCQSTDWGRAHRLALDSSDLPLFRGTEMRYPKRR